MLTFLGIVSKKEKIDSTVDENIKALAARCLTFKQMPYDADSWKSDSGRIAIFAWNNDPRRSSSGAIIEKKYPFALTMSGYTSSPGYRSQDSLLKAIEGKSDPRSVIASIGGANAIAYADGKEDALKVWNSYLRLISVFWCETDEYIVVGNRALLVHLLCQKDRKPKYDLQGLVPFIACGHFANESTPFKNLNIFPPNVEFKATPEGVKLESIDGSEELIGKGEREPDDGYYDELTDALLNALNPLKETEDPITVGITGGKDSRLLISALMKREIPFSSFTTGTPDHPDVIIGKRIAELLGVSHETQTPNAESDTIKVNMPWRATKWCFLCEGLLHAWVFCPEATKFLSTLQITGQGGEFLRGGWLKIPKNNKDFDMEELRDLMAHNFMRFPNCFREDRISAYKEYMNSWIDREAKDHSPRGIADKLFHYIYGGRWVPPSFMVKLCEHNRVYPLSDANYVKKAQEIPVEYRINDYAGYNTLKRLDSRLLNIPFKKWRWGFELEGPVDGDMQSWRERKPINVDKFARQSVDWKQEVGGDLKEEFMQQILHNQKAEVLFEILDRQKIEKMFHSRDMYTSMASRFMFNVYSTSVLLSGEWLDQSEYSPERIVTVRCNYRWFKVNRKVIAAVDKLRFDAEEYFARQFSSRFDDLVSLSEKKFTEWYLKQIDGMQELSDSELEDVKQEFVRRVLAPRLGKGKLIDRANKVLNRYLSKLLKQLGRIQKQFELPQEVWQDNLESFVIMRNSNGSGDVTLKDIVTSAQQVKDKLMLSTEDEGVILDNMFPKEMFAKLPRNKKDLLRKIKKHVDSQKAQFLSLEDGNALSSLGDIHRNILGSVKLDKATID